MPKRLRLEEHLSTEELEDRYRKARDPVLRSHYQIIWLLSLGKLTREVREATGYSPEWIREISRRYNELGAEGLGDRRHQNPVPHALSLVARCCIAMKECLCGNSITVVCWDGTWGPGSLETRLDLAIDIRFFRDALKPCLLLQQTTDKRPRASRSRSLCRASE